MNLNPEQFEEMLAGYALDVLEPDERAAVEGQLAGAPQYQAQLFAYEEALAGLAALTPAVAEPVGHRERMMARLNAAPAVATEFAPATMQTAASVPLPVAALPPTTRKSPQPGMMQRIAGWFSVPGRPGFAVAAASLALAIGLIFWNIGLLGDRDKYQQQAAAVATERDQLKGQIAQLQPQLAQAQGDLKAAQTQLGQTQAAVDLLGQPNTIVKALPGKNNQPAFGQLIANSQQGRGVLFAYNMQPVASDKTYEFWLVDKSGTAIPAGTFNVNDSGKGILNVTMPQNVPISDLAAGAVTIEPAGGLPRPSGEMVIVGNF